MSDDLATSPAEFWERSLDATATVDAVALVAVDPSVRFPEFETVETYPLQ